MTERQTDTPKKTVVAPWGDSRNFMMAENEFTGILVGSEATGSDYVITNGTISPGSVIPDHYHKWEDQTFHIVSGTLFAKIGDQEYTIGPGDSVHCPRGVSHFMKNIGDTEARLISYIFPGDWAEDFMAETSRQNQSGQRDLALIEDRFGVVYL